MFRKHFAVVTQWVTRHDTLLTASIASTIVAIWTVLRHMSNGINFDVVGQIGVAAQWMHGLQGGTLLGATNYIVKMPLYILVNSLDWVPPVIRLLILALICSVGAFLLIYWLARKILHLYGIQNFTLLNLGMLWFATIAGRVFWVDYANSRNLEVAGGVAVLYMVLRMWHKGATWRYSAGATIICSLVFFADPLQLYIIGGGLGVAAIARVFRQSGNARKRALRSGAILLLSSVFSRGLTWLSTVILPVSYLEPPKSVARLEVDTVTTLLGNIVTSTLRIFDSNVLSKALSANSLRQIGGVLLLSLTVYILVRYRKTVSKLPVALIMWLLLWNYLVYAFSGNALTPMTERYLVMMPVLVVILLGLYGDQIKRPQLHRLVVVWLATVAMSGLMLLGGLILQWPNRYHLDQPMFSLAAFATEHSYDFVVTSRGLAIPSNYYAGYDKTIVPTMCADNSVIVATNLFYDQAGYKNMLGRTTGTVAVVLPNEGVVSDPFHCSTASILTRLGTPKTKTVLPGVGTVYEYAGSTPSLRRLN